MSAQHLELSDHDAEVQKGMDDLEAGRYVEVNGPEEMSLVFDDMHSLRPGNWRRPDPGDSFHNYLVELSRLRLSFSNPMRTRSHE